MHLLEGIPIEVYNAYFPLSIVESLSLTSTATRLYPRPNYFPQGPGIVCAEDPQYDVAASVNGACTGWSTLSKSNLITLTMFTSFLSKTTIG